MVGRKVLALAIGVRIPALEQCNAKNFYEYLYPKYSNTESIDNQ